MHESYDRNNAGDKVSVTLLQESDFNDLDLIYINDFIIVSSQLSPVDIHNNGNTVQFDSNVRIDDNWTRNSNSFLYNGNPNHVDINVSINALDLGDSNYWSRPKLRILRNGDTVAVMDNLTMQQNGAYDGDATFSGLFIDPNPQQNPEYTFEWFDKENRTATLIPEPFSVITLKAIIKRKLTI